MKLNALIGEIKEKSVLFLLFLACLLQERAETSSVASTAKWID